MTHRPWNSFALLKYVNDLKKKNEKIGVDDARN